MTDHEPQTEGQSTSISTPTEQMFVRLTFWQTVLSVVGVLIAVIALYAALSESAAVRDQTAATVWPFVQLSFEDHDAQDQAYFTMKFTNVGVGPARIHQLRLEIDGRAMRSWVDAVTHFGGSEASPVNRNFMTNRVLSPGESINLLNTEVPALARQFKAAIENPENSIKFCYCSIFDACWLVDSQQNLQAPATVEFCPDFGDEAYKN